MIDTKNSKFTVNIYDFFANLIPGIVLFAGIFLPFWDWETLPKLGVLQGAFIAIIAFAFGAGLQGIGSKIKRYHFWPFPSQDKYDHNNGPDLIEEEEEISYLRILIRRITRNGRVRKCVRPIIRKRILPFNKKMRELRGEEREEELIFVEKNFFKSCNDIFETEEREEQNYRPHDDLEYMADGGDGRGIIQNTEKSWEYLFKMIFTYLEANPYNRALRIQAQHLGARGLYVAFFILGVWYLFNGLTEISKTQLSNSLWLAFSVAAFVISWLFYIRSVHFENDMVRYMIAEINILSNYEDRL